MTTEHQALLDKELSENREYFESLGARVDGYSGGSPEGDVWQFAFTFECALPPDRASAVVRIYWQHGMAAEPENKMSVTRRSSIFRIGSFSRYENFEKYQCSVLGEPLSLREIVTSALDECRVELEEASKTPIDFAASMANSRN